MAIVPTIITADEVNCLIYSYLQDSGFTHSAFTVKSEAHLDRSPHFRKHIPRGELVELLSKALLYIEVESHWNGSSLALNCKSPFTLLDPHICSLDPNVKAPVLKIPPAQPNETNTPRLNGSLAASPKRRASSQPEEIALKEKRLRLSTDDRMDVDSNSTQPPSDQDESSRSEKTGLKSLDIPSTPCPINGLSTISRRLHSGKRLAGPDDDVTDPSAIRLLQGHKTEVFVCGWHPINVNLLASGSKDAIVHIWDLPPSYEGPPSTPLTLAYLPKEEQGDLTSLDWNADGTLLAIGSYDAILRVCTSTGDLYLSSPQHSGPIFATRFSPSGRWLLTASLDGTACVWDVVAKKMFKQYRCHAGFCCLDIDWLDDSTFASCGADKLIHILRLDSQTPLRTLEGHTDEINQIKCNISSTRLASCSDDKTARIWNVENPSSGEVVVLTGHRNSVSTIGWCPHTPAGQHELLATSGFDGTARLWDSATGDCVKIFTDHTRAVYALSFCPDGMWLATGSGDGWVHVYDVEKREKTWSWYAGDEKPGVFEIDWQQVGTVNRIAFALESRQVGVIDVSKVAILHKRGESMDV